MKIDRCEIDHLEEIKKKILKMEHVISVDAYIMPNENDTKKIAFHLEMKGMFPSNDHSAAYYPSYLEAKTSPTETYDCNDAIIQWANMIENGILIY